MATQFYARYVPPSQSQSRSVDKGQDQADARPKKRKKVDHASNELSDLQHTESKTASRPTVSAAEAALRPRIQTLNLDENEATNRQNGTKHGPASDANGDAQEAVRASHRKRKRRDKKSRNSIEEDVLDNLQAPRDQSRSLEDDKPDDKKFQGIHEKIARSKKIREKLAERQSRQEDKHVSPGDDDLEKVQAEGLKPLPQPAQVPDLPMRSTISALPKWLAKPILVRPDTTALFADMKIDEDIKKRLLAQGFESAFAIQAAVLELLLPGAKHHQGDICISATTGSGKTLAYIVPMIQALKHKHVRRLRGVIVVPTRPLIDQVKETFQKCNRAIEVGTAVGSKPLREESEALVDRVWKFDPEAYEVEQKESSAQGIWHWFDQLDEDDDLDGKLPNLVRAYESKVDVLVCTPGRLVDHFKKTKGFTLEHVQWLVVDEADRLLDQSFQQWLETITPALEKEPLVPAEFSAVSQNYPPLLRRRVRKIILSATIARDVSKLEPLKLYNPALVALEGESFADDSNEKNGREEAQNESATILPSQLTEVAIAVREESDKPLYLLQLIEEMVPFSIPSTAGGRHRSVSLSSNSTSDSSSSMTSDDDDDDDSSLLESSSSSEDDETSSDGSSTSVTNEAQKPASKPKPGPEPETKHGMLVFTKTNENALRLSRLLTILRPALADRISPLTKSLGTASGRKTLAAFRKRNVLVIVASDRASRGLDLKHLAQVVNYDMPKNLTSYVHRIGRTARAGLSGTATTLVAYREAKWFWTTIGRSSEVERAGKVSRREMQLASISDEDRQSYEDALSQLGKEARGERSKPSN
ncbi:ATP-dependent RNA helicase dbp6 [Thelotrema lepadinum]|nr:ATP-dependent RNA helicase dbp6 [Thelotrema lepadinum]